MFDVKWVAANRIVAFVWHRMARLPPMREEFAQYPPDGFLVFDHEGREVRCLNSVAADFRL